MNDNATEISFQVNEVKKKTFVLVIFSFLSALVYWRIITLNLVGNEIQNGAGWPSIICPFLFVGLYRWHETLTEYLGIIGLAMSICMGVFLGAVSGFFDKGAKGLVIQAVLTTFCSVLSIIWLYKNNFIKVNNKFIHFTAFIFETLAFIATIDFIMSIIILDWHSFFSGVTPVAIALNATIILLAYLVFSIDLNIIEEKIKTGPLLKNQSWAFAIGLLVDIGWIYFAVVFLMLRLRGRMKQKMNHV